MNFDDFAALKCALSKSEWWDGGAVGDQHGIGRDSRGFGSISGVPPLQTARSQGGTVGASSTANVPRVPPRIGTKIEVEHIIGNNFGVLKLVPPVPFGNYWPMLWFMMRSVFDALSWYSADVPPCIDDLSARCINRMGGWTKIKDKFEPKLRPGLLCEFIQIAVELIPYKESGFYLRDRLPVLVGKYRKTIAYRLSWPPRLVELRLQKAACWGTPRRLVDHQANELDRVDAERVSGHILNVQYFSHFPQNRR